MTKAITGGRGRKKKDLSTPKHKEKTNFVYSETQWVIDLRKQSRGEKTGHRRGGEIVDGVFGGITTIQKRTRGKKKRK